jgi:hypothetical protein
MMGCLVPLKRSVIQDLSQVLRQVRPKTARECRRDVIGITIDRDVTDHGKTFDLVAVVVAQVHQVRTWQLPGSYDHAIERNERCLALDRTEFVGA